LKITEKLFDVTTQSESILERDMTQDEEKTFILENAALEKAAELRKKDEIDKTALLAKLGITADEAKLLLS